jgi:hypothetical protein
MMIVQLVILPGILLALFLGGVLWLLSRLVHGKIRMMNAEKAAAEAPPALIRLQATAIQDTIAELEGNALTYDSFFPAEIRAELLDAHRVWADSLGKKIK